MLKVLAFFGFDQAKSAHFVSNVTKINYVIYPVLPQTLGIYQVLPMNSTIYLRKTNLYFLDGWWNSKNCWMPIEDENGNILNAVANGTNTTTPVEEFWK